MDGLRLQSKRSVPSQMPEQERQPAEVTSGSEKQLESKAAAELLCVLSELQRKERKVQLHVSLSFIYSSY